MVFTGLRFVMWVIQRLENKYSTDPEASANHFPAQPAVNRDCTKQFLLPLSPFTSFISEESGYISRGLRRQLQILSAGFSFYCCLLKTFKHVCRLGHFQEPLQLSHLQLPEHMGLVP